MNPWTQYKAQQLETNEITAFGIQLVTRHANAYEMRELLAFAAACAQANVNMFVSKAFYDSGSGCCSFTLSIVLEEAGFTPKQAIFNAAQQTLSQFLWYGGVHHGQPLLNEPEPP
jgi:hypothetical protein